MTSCCIPQRSFSFYRHQPVRVDFSGGQITSDAGLLPLRAFDQRYGLTRGLAEHLCDPREECLESRRSKHGPFDTKWLVNEPPIFYKPRKGTIGSFSEKSDVKLRIDLLSARRKAYASRRF